MHNSEISKRLSVYCALQLPNRKRSASKRPPQRKSRRRKLPGQLRQRMNARLQSAEGVRLYRLRKTCEAGLISAELAAREDALENAILAARVEFKDMASLRDEARAAAEVFELGHERLHASL